jgi:hypothetical protein
MRNVIMVILLLLAANAYAEGYMLKTGKFLEGKVTVLSLTPEQKQRIDLDRRCRHNDTAYEKLFDN